MKRTIKEVYDLIKEKRDNAINELVRLSKINALETDRKYVCGNKDAYQDTLSLIESSHLLEKDKPVKGSGLEALEEIQLTCDNTRYSEENSVYEECENDFEIVEKDLQFVEALRKTFKFGIKEQKIGDTKLNMEVIAEKLTNEYDKQIRDFILKECFPKELKALEIIKNVVRSDSILNHLNDWLKIGVITKEQYDLLKEVLCNN